jgi:hypothetical protein
MEDAMALPVVPLVPLLVRAGLVAGSVWAARRMIVRNTHIGRTDQRAEDAMDDLQDGVATHRPRDAEGQQNAAIRLRRSIHLAGRTYEIDAALLGRFRIRKG